MRLAAVPGPWTPPQSLGSEGLRSRRLSGFPPTLSALQSFTWRMATTVHPPKAPDKGVIPKIGDLRLSTWEFGGSPCPTTNRSFQTLWASAWEDLEGSPSLGCGGVFRSKLGGLWQLQGPTHQLSTWKFQEPLHQCLVKPHTQSLVKISQESRRHLKVGHTRALEEVWRSSDPGGEITTLI